MPGSPAARLLWTPTGAGEPTGAGPSRARTAQRQAGRGAGSHSRAGAALQGAVSTARTLAAAHRQHGWCLMFRGRLGLLTGRWFPHYYPLSARQVWPAACPLPQVDRSGAYLARQAAKSVVASGLAARCLVQVRVGSWWAAGGPRHNCYPLSIRAHVRFYTLPPLFPPRSPATTTTFLRGAGRVRHWACPAAERDR